MHSGIRIKYDTVKNVNEIINFILENGNKKLNTYSMSKPLDENKPHEKITY